MKICLLILVSLSSFSAFTACRYSIQPGTESLSWTGYKFNDRTAVSGSFNDLSIKTVSNAMKPQGLLSHAALWIDTNSFESKNPARNSNIVKNLFRKVQKGRVIHARVTDLKLIKKMATVAINWGESEQMVDMAFSFDKANSSIVLEGIIDLVKLGFGDAFSSLKRSCKGKHKGKDGVVKSWSDVKIVVSAKIEKNC